jgi:hypothetical protein
MEDRPKKKVVAKIKNKRTNVSDKSKYVNPKMTIDSILKSIDKSMEPSYNVKVSPSEWVLPNRKKYPNWVDVTFKYKKTAKAKCLECNEGEECVVKPNTVSLFPHQDFVKDYMQFASPYRGILVFHGLGVGKTATSVAAAEMLSNHMSVVVMLPTSLEANYINEIKKYGRQFYMLKQHWTFVPIESMGENLPNFLAKMSVNAITATKNGGIWYPQIGKSPNFNDLPEDLQNEIVDQIDNTISNRFHFVHYDGLRKQHIKDMTKNETINPFDNKCVIVDEVHNFISRVSNGRMIGSAIYKLLMSAKNCKLIFLSGTPLINYPYEIAFLINLLTGPRVEYCISLLKNSKIDTEVIDNILAGHENVDIYSFEINTRKIYISLLPEGFKFKDKASSTVERYKENSKSHEDIFEKILDEITKKGFKIYKKSSKNNFNTLPEKQEQFNNLFVSMDDGQMRNQWLFMKRILGVVSYYSSYSPELYPSVEIKDVPLELSDYQFGIYEKSRDKERSKEKSASKFKGSQDTNNIFNSSGQVYRFYSRANCNFVFPQDIDRPTPSSFKSMKSIKEIDDLDNSLEEDDEKSNSGEKNKDDVAPKEYSDLVKEALSKLYKSDYLLDSNIEMYSPKFKLILKHIVEMKGTSLVYSQFRTVEGLGVFALTMKKNGFAEFKVKKVGDQWDIDINLEDYHKPKYMEFTGNNEQTQILLKIFNSDLENLPVLIKNKLKELDTQKKNEGNLYGSLIKTCMITQSGAEGISLKNVRQVHIVEPYWNHIRIDQVIGRAVRTCSHVNLPPSKQNVTVYVYYTKFSQKQLAGSFTLKNQDKGKTSDEYIYDIAKRKKNIIDQMLEMMKRASVDCGLNAHSHPGLKCFSFPINIDDNKYMYVTDINNESLDYQIQKHIMTEEWEGKVMITKKGNFLIDEKTNKVYDYDIYKDSGKLVRIGTIDKEGNKKIIKLEF